jgi:hypothetical protein
MKCFMNNECSEYITIDYCGGTILTKKKRKMIDNKICKKKR